MAEAKTVSIHKTTTGGVSEFLEDEAFECLSSVKLLSYLAGALLRYQEEGVELNPQVVFCESVEAVVRSIPGGKYYRIGSADFTAELGKKVLKECAALTQSAWVIYIERISGTQVRYGVLSYLITPTSLLLEEMIAINDTTFAVLIWRFDNTTVRLSGAKGNSLSVAFSTVREIAKSEGPIEKFADSCLPIGATDLIKRYVRNLLSRLLSASHGTILVCTSTDITHIAGMADAVTLSPPIDLVETFESYRSGNTADALLELQRLEGLLIGLFQSDGIIAFSDTGQIVAYRVFYKPVANRGQQLDAEPAVTGGARRRAFEGVRGLVGPFLRSALFRSQDGYTMFEGV